MIGALMRLDTVNMGRIQGEIFPPVMEHDARPPYYRSTAKGLIEAVDHRDGIPFSVNHGQIDRVLPGTGKLCWGDVQSSPVWINP
jgi:hypothetical protein